MKKIDDDGLVDISGAGDGLVDLQKKDPDPDPNTGTIDPGDDGIPGRSEDGPIPFLPK